MRACCIDGEMTALANGRIQIEVVRRQSSSSTIVHLSPEQAREWARVLIFAAQEIDGEPMKLSVGLGAARGNRFIATVTIGEFHARHR